LNVITVVGMAKTPPMMANATAENMRGLASGRTDVREDMPPKDAREDNRNRTCVTKVRLAAGLAAVSHVFDSSSADSHRYRNCTSRRTNGDIDNPGNREEEAGDEETDASDEREHPDNDQLR
jgi:hypothetical protein